MKHSTYFLLLFSILTISFACGESHDPFDATQVERWRAKHEADYRREWVTIAGIHFLEPGRHDVGSAPTNEIVLPATVPEHVGTFVLVDGTVTFDPVRGAGVRLNSEPIATPTRLRDDENGKADELAVAEIRMAIHVSGTRRSVRIWDPNSERVRQFKGFTWFPIDERYHVIGRFIKDPQPKRMQVVNTFGDLDTYTTEGVVQFTLNGSTLRLRPFTTRPNRFYFVFRDASAGHETYSTARFLYSDLRDDGTTVLDFNEAYNPPCAFNPFTTCPIPMPENRLPVKVLAGERAYAGSPEH